MITNAAVNFALCMGKNESELEDLYDPSVFEKILIDECGMNLRVNPRKRRVKWSKQLKFFLQSCGKKYDEIAINAIKMRIANSAKELGIKAIHDKKSGPINSLISTLEKNVSR